MRKILLSGYYGFNNLGDEALLQGLLTALSPKHDLTILSAQPAQSRTLHQHKARHRYTALLPALWQHDVLISGGGSLLQDKTSRRSLQYYLGVIRLAKWLGKKVIVYGQSIGPLSEWGQQQLVKVLQDVPIAVRDKASQRLLASWGIEAMLCADAALLLAPSMVKKAEAEKKQSKNIILIPRAGYPELSQSLIALAQNYPADYSIMPLQPHEDAQEMARIQAALPRAAYLHVIQPKAALEQLQRASFVFSGRLHGAILAAVAERPFAAFAYDPKVQAFCDEADAPCFPVQVASASLQEVLEPPLKQQEVQLEAIHKLRNRAHAGIDWLLEVVNSG